MGKTIFILVLIATTTLTAQNTWKADTANSNINFTVSHLMISEVTGSFSKFNIEATADEAFGEPSFTVSIPTSSIYTGNSRRDDHLRSDDFFAVEKHPSMDFKTISIEKTGEKSFKMMGDFTLHGITKQVTLAATLNGIITDQRSQKLKAGLKLTGMINRKDYEVGTKPFPIGDEVSMTINLEMLQQ